MSTRRSIPMGPSVANCAARAKLDHPEPGLPLQVELREVGPGGVTLLFGRYRAQIGLSQTLATFLKADTMPFFGTASSQTHWTLTSIITTFAFR